MDGRREGGIGCQRDDGGYRTIVALMRAKDRKEWRALVHINSGCMNYDSALFAGFCVFSDRPPDLSWLVTGACV